MCMQLPSPVTGQTSETEALERRLSSLLASSHGPGFQRVTSWCFIHLKSDSDSVGHL